MQWCLITLPRTKHRCKDMLRACCGCLGHHEMSGFICAKAKASSYRKAKGRSISQGLIPKEALTCRTSPSRAKQSSRARWARSEVGGPQHTRRAHCSFLHRLSRLIDLDASDNHIEDTIESIVSLTNLKTLDLHNNYFRGTVPKEISRLYI